MSMIKCKYGCLSDTDEFPEFEWDEEEGYTCEFCVEEERDSLRMFRYFRSRVDSFLYS